MARIPIRSRAELSELILGARERARLSQDEVAERASEALREMGEEVAVTRHHISGLETCPAAPLASAQSRLRLLGVALALGLDRAEINRLAGGV